MKYERVKNGQIFGGIVCKIFETLSDKYLGLYAYWKIRPNCSDFLQAIYLGFKTLQQKIRSVDLKARLHFRIIRNVIKTN